MKLSTVNKRQGPRGGLGWGAGGGGGREGERWVHSGPVMAEHTTGVRGHAPPENFNLGVLKG